MDYLNYGKQVQNKPQAFDQQKVELTPDDFRFGDLGENTIPQEISQEKAQQLLSSAIQEVTQPN